MDKKEWVEMTAWVKREQREQFHARFKNHFSWFVRKCIDRALSEKDFMAEILFGKGEE